jgi:dienelactone hydrolase
MPLARAAVLIVALALAVAAGPRSVTFRTDDGVTIAATWYEPSTRPAPAVILVHMLHRTRHDWDALASRFASEGIGALTFDLRGHGESTGPALPEGQYSGYVADLAAARRYVMSRPDADPSRIAIVGASLGASIAALEAAQAPGIVGIALLSPASDYRGVKIDAAMRKYPGRALIVYSDDDPYAQRSARELVKASGPLAPRRETLPVSHAGHGTNMLAADPDLARQLVDWLKRTVE